MGRVSRRWAKLRAPRLIIFWLVCMGTGVGRLSLEITLGYAVDKNPVSTGGLAHCPEVGGCWGEQSLEISKCTSNGGRTHGWMDVWMDQRVSQVP